MLSDGAHTWTIPWSEAGLRLDAEATVQKAFAIGHDDQDLVALLRVWRGHHEITPVFAVDPEVARSVLEQLAPEVAVPPTDATLRLDGDQLVAVPGQPGRALDVEATLDNIVAAVAHLGPDTQFALAFELVSPHLADTKPVQAQAEQMLDRQMDISTVDWFTGEAFNWALGREAIATWLRVEQAQNGSGPSLRIAAEAVEETLVGLAAEMGEGRGFQMDGATEEVLSVFEAGGGTVELRLTHPPRIYTVQSGDRLTTIGAQFGMPPGLIAEANPGVDLDHLQVGQELMIPSEDVLRPYPTVPGKEIVISVAEQRMRVYENGVLLYDWPVSTGLPDSPTYTGHFQVLSKQENAFASQWDLWMPHFMGVYVAGGGVYNGIHALPILASGQRLWEGSLGSPASFGCIILGIQEAEALYNWADIGVSVVIE
jgi:lipoprotein-anchoring transpeptidase ErfK/SrfK